MSSTAGLRRFGRGAPLMTDPLAALEAEGIAARAAERAERKAERKAAKQSDASKRGRNNKRKGYKAEKKMESLLEDYGFRRVVMSGALGHGKDDPLSHDIRRDSGIVRHIEVKRRTGGCKQIRGWLEHAQSDALLIDTGGRDVPLVVMSIDLFKRYLEVEK